ncbi:hypothetical protein [Kitasatospora sp. NPDC058190]|uniref:hypothetical protein n=1 Tax=Kitasatospora sp. NPDC058190 TaxID=3346371 RepID=UPI0036DE7B91
MSLSMRRRRAGRGRRRAPRPVTELRCLLAGAERDLVDFLTLAADCALRHLPDFRAPVIGAFARVLDLPAPAMPPEQ